MIVQPVVARTFIGRSEELAHLHAERLRASKSRGGVVIVTGDAGIGKSRLLAEFCAPLAHSRFRVGVGICLERAQRAYGAVLDVLAACDGGSRELIPAATKREQLDAIVDRFARVAEKQTVVGIVEDVHWADAATLELLAFLAPKLERLRVLLVVSTRPFDAVSEHTHAQGLARLVRAVRTDRIELAPLDAPDLDRFIDDALGERTLPTKVRHFVARTSEGNPFFAEELLRSAVERGDATLLPSSLRATLLERWYTLSDDDRTILGQAAVIGRAFELPLLARTLERDVDELLPALARAREAQLIEEIAPARFRFRHTLTREAIYGTFLGARVRALHRTIAIVLESEPAERRSLEGLAYHWWAAGDAEASARYNELAGDAAARVHAHDDAIACYERVLESTAGQPRTRGLINEKIADRQVALGAIDAAFESYGAAAAEFARVPDDEGEARCRVRAAICAYTLGRPSPTSQLEALLERLDPAAFAARSRVHVGMAWLTATFGNPTRAAYHLAQVDERALAAPDLALRFHNISAWNAMMLGDLETFRREHVAWVAAAGSDAAAAANSHYNGAACYSSFGLHEEAIEHVGIAIEIARNARNRHAELAGLGNAAAVALASGDLARAKAALDAIPATLDSTITLVNSAGPGVLAGLHLDDRTLIAKWFDDVGPTVMETIDGTLCGAAFAEILVRRGRPAEAIDVLRRAIPDCERVRGMEWTLVVAARYAAPEDAARARDLLVRGADGPADVVEGPSLALFDAYAAQREGRTDDAIAHARAAAEGFARLRFPLYEAAAREVAGETDIAIALYRRCGAAGDVRRLSGDRPISAASQDATKPRLSKRELDIATYVADGKSNIEIGRSLSISHKTVEKHLTSMYAKLGVRTRAQLAAYIGREDGAAPR